MIYEVVASQLLFWGIVYFSYKIYVAFNHSVGDKLKYLVMELFLTKMWTYGIAAAYYLMYDLHLIGVVSSLWIRIICNAPMVWVMYRLWNYIKNYK
jgi:hypothetical protein